MSCVSGLDASPAVIFQNRPVRSLIGTEPDAPLAEVVFFERQANGDVVGRVAIEQGGGAGGIRGRESAIDAGEELDALIRRHDDIADARFEDSDFRRRMERAGGKRIGRSRQERAELSRHDCEKNDQSDEENARRRRELPEISLRSH